MHVSHLSLADFRTYPQVELALQPGPTALVGPNGQGKTNLVEAIGYVATLGSHRVATDAPLVRAGAERAIVRTAVERDGRTTLVELEITPGRANRARLNRSPVPRPREVLGVLRSVLFAPEDLALVKGDPDGRRRFLDDLLVAARAAVRRRPLRLRPGAAPAQRPAQAGDPGRGRGRSGASRCRTGRAPPSTRPWTSGTPTSRRSAPSCSPPGCSWWPRLAPYVREAYQQVSDATGQAVLGYRSHPRRGAARPRRGARRRRRAARPRRARRGDDGRAGPSSPARGRARASRWSGRTATTCCSTSASCRRRGTPATASRGRTRSRCGSGRYQLLRTEAGAGDGDPVLVLDDVFAELDSGRRTRLAGLVAGAEQVLVTAAVEADVPPELVGDRVRVRSRRGVA